MQNPPIQQFWATVYMADNAFYKDGKQIAIHCNHINEGDMGITTVGHIVPLPTTRVASPPVPSVMVPEATLYPSPTAFADNFKPVTKVKDMTLLVVYYVDTASYNANVIKCNPVT